MPTAKIGGVKAADPGLGFTLNFDPALNNSLKVVIRLTDLQKPTNAPYTSEVTLQNSISDKELVFVVPFGDNAYAPSNQFSFQIDLYWPSNASIANQTLTGVVMGENGSFSFSTSVPTTITGVPQTGDMLQTEDGAFIGVYNTNGEFCVYPQFADSQSDFNKVYSTHSDIGQPTIFYINGLNNGMSFISISTPDSSKTVSQTVPFPSQSQTTFSINSMGILCINDLPIYFNKV